MIDTQTKQRTFREFCNWVVTEPELSVNTVMVEAMTYAPVQKYFSTHTEDLAKLSALSETEALGYLRALFSEPGFFTPGEHEGATTGLPTETVPPAHTQETDEAVKSAKNLRTQKEAWVRSLVPEFVEELAKKKRSGATTPADEIPKERAEKAAKIIEEVLIKTPPDEIILIQKIEEKITHTSDLLPYKPIIVAAAKRMIEKPDVISGLRQRVEEEKARTAKELTPEEMMHFVQAKEVVSQVRNRPGGVGSFGPPPASVVQKTIAKPTPKSVQAELVQALVRAADDDGIVGGVIARLGKNVATREGIKAFIVTGSQELSQHAPSGGGAILDLVSDVVSAGKTDPGLMADYIAASHGGHFSFVEYLLVLQQRSDPGSLTRSSSGLLHWAAGIGLEKGTKTALGIGKLTAKEVGAAALTKIGLKGIASWAGGPVGFVLVLVGDKLLEWGGKIVGATINTANYLLSGGIISSILQGKPASLLDTFVLFPVVLMVILVALFVFPWFLNLQQFPEDVRRTALVTSVGGGAPGPEAPKCLDMSIAATTTGPTEAPTAIEYTVNVSPTCEGELAIGSAIVSFSSIGATTTPIAPQTITPAQLSGGSFSFSLPVGPQMNNSVIAAIFTLSATVGTTSTSGVVNTTTVIGNPVNDILIPGNAGFPPMGWCVGTNTPASPL